MLLSKNIFQTSKSCFSIQTFSDSPKMTTNWTNKRLFQLGLILLSIVVGTFLVIMISVYFLFFLARYTSKNCDTVCSLLLYWKEEIQENLNQTESLWLVDLQNISTAAKSEKETNVSNSTSLPIRQKLRKRFINNLEYTSHLPVAALLEKQNYENCNDQVFKCTVAYFSPTWALTTTNCFNYSIVKWPLFTVRTNAENWLKGGNIKKIRKVYRNQNLVAIKFKSDRSKTTFYISNLSNISNNATTGKILYWNVSLKLPFRKSFKYDTLNIKTLPIEKMQNLTESDTPIFDLDQNLIGFQSYKFTKKDVGRYRFWLKKLRVLP